MSKKIGFLVAATKATWREYIRAFENELGKKWTIDHTGTAVGINVVFIDYQPQKDANGKAIDGAAADLGLIQQTAALFADPKNNYDVIVTAGEVAAKACYDATNPQPPPAIVVASAGDLSKLAGGNLTGCNNGQVVFEILDERIAWLLQKLKPQSAVAVVGNHSVDPVQTAMDYAVASLRAKLKPKNIPVYPASFTQANDFKDHQTIQKKLNPPLGIMATADVLLVCSDPLMRTHGDDFVAAAKGHPTGKMRTMHEFGEWYTEHKGDQCFGPDFRQLFQTAAGFVAQYFSTGNLPAVFTPKVTDCVPTPP